MIEKGGHYKKSVITSDMVGLELDPAFFASIHTMDNMLFQAFKKIAFAGKRGKKERLQDLRDAIGAIERQIELDKLKKGINND